MTLSNDTVIKKFLIGEEAHNTNLKSDGYRLIHYNCAVLAEHGNLGVIKHLGWKHYSQTTTRILNKIPVENTDNQRPTMNYS